MGNGGEKGHFGAWQLLSERLYINNNCTNLNLYFLRKDCVTDISQSSSQSELIIQRNIAIHCHTTTFNRYRLKWSSTDLYVYGQDDGGWKLYKCHSYTHLLTAYHQSIQKEHVSLSHLQIITNKKTIRQVCFER